MYKLIALDMDGTLLNKEKKITKRTKEALAMAREKGVKVVIATGRPIAGLSKYINELDLMHDDEYVLSYNGCLVQEIKGEKIIHEVGLTGRDLHYIYDLSINLGVNIHAFSAEKGLITPKLSKYTSLEGELNNIEVNIVDFSKISENENIVKIMLIDEEKVLDEAIKNIPKEIYEKYNIVKSAPFFLEIMNKEGNKGVGLKALAEHLNISKEEIIAVGDAGNDKEMIEFAGLGVAMENAIEEIKNIANFITENNNNDGIAKIVDDFIINK